MGGVNGSPSPAVRPATAGSPLGQRLTYGFGSVLVESFVRLRVEGRGHGEGIGPFLLASNHRSHFDPPLLTRALGCWIDWAAMTELYRHRWLARYWDALAVIPVDRSRLDRRAATTVLRRLRGGRIVGIFPEGGIRAGERSVLAGGPLDAGACRLALAAKVPLVPAVILGSERMYAPGGWLFPRRAFRVTVRFGAPLLPTEGQKADKAAAEALNERLAEALRRLADGDGKR